MGINPSQTESKFKCLYKGSSDNIVKVVFYAVVVSVLASAYFSIAGNNIVYITSLCDLWHKVTHAVNCKKCLFAMVPLAYFLFFTGYFYDEWRRSSRVKTHTPNSCEPLDVLAWCCFILQVTFLKVPSVSAGLGIIGCVLASWSLLRLNDWSSIWSIKFWKWPEAQQWIVQNIVWIFALFFLQCHCVIVFVVAVIIIIWKVLLWLFNPPVESDVKSESQQSFFIDDSEFILMKRMFQEYRCSLRHPPSTSMPSSIENCREAFGVSHERCAKLWECCLALIKDYDKE